MGIPTFNIGPYPVEPIASVGFLLSLIFFGLGGLFFSGLLFFIVKYSQMGLGGGRAIRLPAWINRLGFGGNNPTQGVGPRSQAGQANRRPGDRGQDGNQGGAAPRNAGPGRWSGGGNRLGDS